MRLIIIMILLLLIAPAVTADDNGDNVTQLKDKISNLEDKIKSLKEDKKSLKKENTQLNNDLVRKDRRINDLKNKVGTCDEWDAREVMRKLWMVHDGEYQLLWHKGGYGFFVMFQYVGPWNGQYGEFNQYTQIAKSKLNKSKAVGELVIEPEWGFNGSQEVVIRGRSDVKRIESKYNSPHGVATYLRSVQNQKDEAVRYMAGHTIFLLGLLAVGFTYLGERTNFFHRLFRLITSTRLTDMGDRDYNYKLMALLGVGVFISGVMAHWVTRSGSATALSAIISFIVIYALIRRFYE